MKKGKKIDFAAAIKAAELVGRILVKGEVTARTFKITQMRKDTIIGGHQWTVIISVKELTDHPETGKWTPTGRCGRLALPVQSIEGKIPKRDIYVVE